MLTAFAIKIIVSVCMLLDHMHVVFPAIIPHFFRYIARIALPIYIPYMIASGCKHTKNINKYLFRLGIFALISEIPFDLAFNDGRIDFFADTNVFYTLFLGAACISIYEKLKASKRPHLALLPMLLVIPLNPMLIFQSPIDIVTLFIRNNILIDVKWYMVFLIVYGVYTAFLLYFSNSLSKTDHKNGEPFSLPRKLLALIPVLPLIYFASILGTDGGTVAVAFIFLTYLFNPENKVTRAIMMTSYLATRHVYPYLYFTLNGDSCGWPILPGGMINNGSADLIFFGFALIGVALICLYNGKQGKKLKWGFYAFYPVHLAVLAAIKYISVA